MDVKWHIPSTRLDAPTKWFSTGIYSINRASERLWLATQETSQKGQNVLSFQVRTPICHIVPVSRAYGGGGDNYCFFFFARSFGVPGFGLWSPKCGCKATVTVCFALIALVAWK